MFASQKKCSDKTSKILTSQRIITYCNTQRILCMYVCVLFTK